MDTSATRLSFVLRCALAVIFLISGFAAKGQNGGNSGNTTMPSIINLQVLPDSLCRQSDLTVKFQIQNGTGKRYFQEGTTYNYTVFLETETGTPVRDIYSFSSNTVPPPANRDTVSLERTFMMPADIVAGNYQIKVCVDHPDFDCATTGYSNIFTVNPLPTLTWSTPGSVEACYNEEVIVRGKLTGTAPFTISGMVNGAPITIGMENQSFQYSLVTTQDTEIVLTAVTDANSCTVSLNKTKQITLLPHTWTGSIDKNWHNPGNWSCNTVPSIETDVVIPQTPIQPVVSTGGPGLAKDISLESGGKLTIEDQILKLAGIINNGGTIDAQNGGLVFTGSSAQVLPVNGFLNNTIKNLTVDNPSGVTLSGPLGVTGTVLAKTGNLTSSGNLKLISTTDQTALIDGSGTGEILGNISMQRHLEVAYGYKYFSTPFQNTTVGDFVPFMDLIDPQTGFPHVYSYNENKQTTSGSDASGWETYTTSTNPFSVGRGYALNFGNNAATPVTVELTGSVNNGPYQQTLDNHGGEYTKGFHLVGNPYPSPIDWNLVNRTNIDGAIYFFTAGTTPYTGSYTAYVNTVSSDPDPPTDGRSSNIIPSMQGFFVKVSEPADGVYPATGSLEFTNASRVVDFSQPFLKGSKKKKKSDLLVRISAGFKGKEHTDALVIYSPEHSRPEFESDQDAFEILNTDPTIPSFYTLALQGKKLSINALPISAGKEVSLGLTTVKSGIMEIRIRDIRNIPDGLQIYLRDQKSRVLINLSQETSYRFNISKGVHERRFQLLFQKKDPKTTKEGGAFPFSVFTGNQNPYIDLDLRKQEQGILQISSLQGRLLKERTVSGQVRVLFPKGASAGVYIVTLNLKGKRFSKKVIIQK